MDIIGLAVCLLILTLLMVLDHRGQAKAKSRSEALKKRLSIKKWVVIARKSGEGLQINVATPEDASRREDKWPYSEGWLIVDTILAPSKNEAISEAILKLHYYQTIFADEPSIPPNHWDFPPIPDNELPGPSGQSGGKDISG